jgi:ParB family chromosome partitioning protein
MTIAKKLQGGGGSFDALTHGEARGRTESAARSEALDATGRVRRSSLAPVSSIIFNPLNPRKTILDETIDELAESLRRRQIVPITVVSRYAFLDAHPDQAAALGKADFVALDGNRRLLAAQRAGLESLRVDLNDDLVATAADMVEAALVANVHREDVLPLEEAQAIEQLLVTVYDGNQAALARRLGKSAAWVGQRLALLYLTPELQEQAGSGELPIEEARKIGAQARAGKLTAPEQQQRAEAAKKAAKEQEVARAAARAERASRKPAGSKSETGVNAVYPQQVPVLPDDSSGPHAAGDVNGVYPQGVPEQRDAAERRTSEPVTLLLSPSDAPAAAQIIRAALDARQTAQVVLELLAILQEEPDYQEIADLLRSEHS